MTLRELAREFVVATEREEDRMAHATAIAYQTVKCWAMTKGKKKMPKFSDLLPNPVKRPSGRPQTLADQHELIYTIAKRYGGKVVKAE